MKRGPLLGVLAVVAVTPSALVVACTFPDVLVVGDAGADAGRDAIGADSREDVLISVGEAGAGDPCDVDRDGRRAQTCADGAAGDDCDDKDSRANAGVVDFQSYDDLGRVAGDWNCDKTVEKEFKDGVGDCAGLVVGCAREGFVSPAACGASGAYVRCEVVDGGLLDGGVSCQRTLAVTRVQRCR